MFKIKMLADSGEYKTGETHEVADDIAKSLIASGLAEFVEPDAADIASEVKELVAAAVRETVAETVKGLSEGAKKFPLVTEVHDCLADDPKGGFASAAEFLKAVASAGRGNIGKKLIAWEGATKVESLMQEGDDAQGGFLVPTQFLATLKMNTIIDDGIPGMCTNLPMQTNTIGIPYINETTHATHVYGGVIVYRTAEGETKESSKPGIGLCTLTLHKTTVLTFVTDELLEDSPISIGPIIATMFPQALNFTLADDILNGTGAGQGLGIILAPATITVARAGAGAIAFADIIAMWSRLYPRSAGNAVWFANSDTFPQLATMSLVVGAAGSAAYLPANGLAAAPYGTLMGRPLILTELAQTLGTAGDIILADLSQMFLGTKGGIKSSSSVHLKFDENKTAFKSELRSDNQPWWPAPLTPRYSTNTVSPFVILGDVEPTTTSGA